MLWVRKRPPTAHRTRYAQDENQQRDATPATAGRRLPNDIRLSLRMPTTDLIRWRRHRRNRLAAFPFSRDPRRYR